MISALENIYISPLETCNLNCRSCYTRKTQNILSNKQILSFVRRYQKYLKKESRNYQFFESLNVATHSQSNKIGNKTLKLKSILLCGGEIFILPDFPQLVNDLLSQNIFVTVITNGTIDRLLEIGDPHNCQLIVSFDGPQSIHDTNRGEGNFNTSQALVKHALELGFPVEIFYLVTKDSYKYIDQFKLSDLKITYLTDRLGSLTPDQVLNIKRHYPTYPSKNFGCFQLALQSDGFIYGCCESPLPLASVSDPIPTIINNFKRSLNTCSKCKLGEASQIFRAQSSEWLSYEGASTKNLMCEPATCRGCYDPNFLCGYIQEFDCQNCHQVVKLFNQ